MKTLKFIICALLVCVVCSSQAQVSQTISNAYTIEAEINQLFLDLETNATIEIRKTAASRVSIETTIKANVPNDKMLSFLIEQGRYTNETTTDKGKGTLKIANKKNKTTLMVKGKECTEEFVYIIYVPNQIQFVKNTNGDNIFGNNTAVSLHKE
jgi:outer membrane murein-binding lipoprotein Lpp